MMNRSMGMGGNPNNMSMQGGSQMNRGSPTGNFQQQGGNQQGPRPGMMGGGGNQSMMMGGGGGYGNQQQQFGGGGGWQNNSMQQMGGGMNNSMQHGGGWGNQSMGQQGQWGQQQGILGNCCQPTMPGMPVEQYICGNEMNPSENPLNPLAMTCDCATIATGFFALMSIIGFAIVMAVSKPDQIFKIYDGCSNTSCVQDHMITDVPYLFMLRNASNNRTDELGLRIESYTIPTTTVTAPPTISTAGTQPTSPTSTTSPTTSSTTAALGEDRNFHEMASGTGSSTNAGGSSTAPPQTSLYYNTEVNWMNTEPDPVWRQPCTTMKSFTGTWGEVCVEQAMNAANFYFQLHRWTVFRNTLYFIAMCGSLLVLALVFLIHRVKNPPFGSPQYNNNQMNNTTMGGGKDLNTTYGGANNYQQGMDPPVTFANTNFYLVFRAAWGAVSVVIFLWVVTVMYEFLRIIGEYKDLSTGDLHKFWVDYEKKFTASVVCIAIYLCWPLAHLGLEIGLFVGFVIPYYIFRSMCKQGIENYRYPIETPLDEIPGWVRIDMFFTDFNQLKRLGFSVQMWHLLTGTYKEYFEMCDTPNPNLMMQTVGGGAEGGMMNGNNTTMGGGGYGNNNNTTMMNGSMQSGGVSRSGSTQAQNGTRGPNKMEMSMFNNTANMLPSGNGDMSLTPTRRDKSDKKEKSRDKSRDKDGKSAERRRSHSRRRSDAGAESPSGLFGGDGGATTTDAERTTNRRDKSDKTEKREKRDKTDKKDKHHRSESSRSKADKKDKGDGRSKSKKEKKDKNGVSEMDD